MMNKQSIKKRFEKVWFKIYDDLGSRGEYGGIPYHKDDDIWNFISKEIDKAVKEERAYIGKLKREAYMRGVKEERIDYTKEAEKFEKEMTSGLGMGKIHGMGNIHLFAQKLNLLKPKK